MNREEDRPTLADLATAPYDPHTAALAERRAAEISGMPLRTVGGWTTVPVACSCGQEMPVRVFWLRTVTALRALVGLPNQCPAGCKLGSAELDALWHDAVEGAAARITTVRKNGKP